MSEPFLGEMRWVAFNYAPRGWAFCNGQLLPINQNQALFALLGTMYGGDGRVNFALPDMRGRVGLHVGAGFVQGQRGGEEAHAVTISELPMHTHMVVASGGNGTLSAPAGNYLANRQADVYVPAGGLVTMAAGAVGSTGGSQPHPNLSPYAVLNCIVAIIGIFPSRN